MRVDWTWSSTFLAWIQAVLQGNQNLFQREILPKERRREVYWSISKGSLNVESILRRNENASIFIFLNRSFCWVRTSFVSTFVPKFNSFLVHFTWRLREETQGNARKTKTSCWNSHRLIQEIHQQNWGKVCWQSQLCSWDSAFKTNDRRIVQFYNDSPKHVEVFKRRFKVHQNGRCKTFYLTSCLWIFLQGSIDWI